MSTPQLQTLSPKYVNKKAGAIFFYKGRYVFVPIDLGTMVIGKRLRDVLSWIYPRIISVFFDREGNLHVRYEEPFYDVNDVLIDYEFKEDVWKKMW